MLLYLTSQNNFSMSTAKSIQPLNNYALGKWIAGEGNGQLLYNAITGDAIATASSKGLDFAAMCDYARTVGGPKLRKMTFPFYFKLFL